MPGEWVTTNGYDCVFYLSDGTQIDVSENDDETWSLVRTNTVSGEVFEEQRADARDPLMRAARAIWKALGVKTVPSEAQAAAPWFRGADYDYTRPDSERRRQWITRTPSIKTTVVPPSPVAYQPGDTVSIAVTTTVDPVAHLNAMLTAYRLNEMMKPKAPPAPEWHCDRCRNTFGGDVPVCPECGGTAHA